MDSDVMSGFGWLRSQKPSGWCLGWAVSAENWQNEKVRVGEGWFVNIAHVSPSLQCRWRMKTLAVTVYTCLFATVKQLGAFASSEWGRKSAWIGESDFWHRVIYVSAFLHWSQNPNVSHDVAGHRSFTLVDEQRETYDLMLITHCSGAGDGKLKALLGEAHDALYIKHLNGLPVWRIGGI